MDEADDDDGDESLHAASTELSLPSFLSSVHGVALHAMQSQQVRRSGRVLKSAQMRLQGVRSVFQWFKDADEVDAELQEATLRRWERVLQKIPRLSAGLTLSNDDADNAVHGEEERMQQERRDAEQRMGIHDEAQPGRPPRASPMSQRAGLPFSRLLSQIRRAHGDAAGEAADAEVERLRASNPLLHTTTVFCASSPSSHVDNRGRLVLAMRETDGQWFSFLGLSTLFPLVEERATAFRHCKELEQQTAALLAVHDLFSDLSLTSTPPYVAYLLQLQQASHLFHGLFASQPRLRQQLVLRVDASSTAPSIDPELGLVLVPIAHPIPGLLAFLTTHGQRAVDSARAYASGKARYDDAVLAVKRRYRVRRLERERGVSEGEMVDCCERLMRAGGAAGGLRGWLEGMEVGVGREYRFAHDDGRIVIPWDWQMTVDSRSRERSP